MAVNVWVYFWTVSSALVACVSVVTRGTLLKYVLESESESPPKVLFCNTVFGCLGFIAIHMNLNMSFTICKNRPFDFESALNLFLLGGVLFG